MALVVGRGRRAVRLVGGHGAAYLLGRLRHVKLARPVGWDRAARAVGC